MISRPKSKEKWEETSVLIFARSSLSLSLPFFPSLLDKQQKITNIRRSRVSRTFRFTLFYFFKTPKMHLLFFSSFHVFALKIFQPTITQREYDEGKRPV
jgi:hypothetical protein